MVGVKSNVIAKIGKEAEECVVEYLRTQQYVIVARRYHSCYGEIDIVAKHGQELVFVEVKARKMISDYTLVSSKQQRKIARTALTFLKKNQEYIDYCCRFDTVIVVRGVVLQHIKGAWEYEEEVL